MAASERAKETGMPQFTFRMEMAVALDIDFEVAAADEEAAQGIAWDAASAAAPPSALVGQFEALNGRLAIGDVVISDVRMLAPATP